MNLENYRIDVPDADIFYIPDFLSKVESKIMFHIFLDNIIWRQDDIKIFGKYIAQPRLTALYGDENKSYGYSNIRMLPNKWIPELLDIKQKIEERVAAKFTTVLLNLYRDGNDSNGWHSDNEKELGVNPIIASISLGAEREFQMKHKILDIKSKIYLSPGSLFVMRGETQKNWKHQIPKTKKIIEKRINLTFRNIVQ